MKVVISFIWLLALLAGLIYAAVIGNPAAQGFVFFIVITLLMFSVIYSVLTISKWLNKL